MKESEKMAVIRKFGKNYKKILLKDPYVKLKDNQFGGAVKRTIDLGFILDLFRLPLGSRILDLGCGTGWTSVFLAKVGYRVTGVDVSPHGLDVAKERARRERVKAKFVLGDFETFSFSRKFDGVLFYDSLHHTANKFEVIKNAYRNLDGGGKIVIFEPNWIHARLSKKVTEKYGVTEEGCSILGWKKLFKKAGFRNIKTFYYFDRLYRNDEAKEILSFLAKTIYKTLPFDIASRVVLNAEKP